ncbi:hypothetical protein, partial [Candidatus Litorirhabdus singularis]|uniref:hypothetical protein n=1 Tax=Candidatus Litorirhabdus singularis TaxID=2518993 RepID=UPI003B968320
DLGDGQASDHDVFYAGQGNDDLIGGSGTNDLYAWSRDPELGGQFGVFVDANGTLRDTDGNGLYTLEDTGLNRMLGGSQADQLFGGTGLDFLYGNGGDDVLYRRDGQSFDTLDGGQVEGDEWKEYARASTEVWYYGGTNANDVITVDFVTEPGLLGDHHLITRLTEVNGNFSFDATVRLDFQATDNRGNLIWEARRLLSLVEDPLTGLQTEAAPSLNGLLPAEGDFQVIIIDALGGNDQIIVGPTVQKSVWVDAGAGDDRVTILGGTSILADKAELGTRNDSAAFAHALGGTLGASDVAIAAVTTFAGLTLDNPQDQDYFSFRLGFAGELQLTVNADFAGFTYEVSIIDPVSGEAVQSIQVVPGATIGTLTGLAADTGYLIRVSSPDLVPAVYSLTFAPLGSVDTPLEIDLAQHSLNERRDIVLGGDGNDVLSGG